MKFEPVTLSWDGKPYVIPANQVMKALAVIEDHCTMFELQKSFKSGGVPLAKISNAFAAVIRFAGGTVTAEEVYAGMFGGGPDAQAAQQAVTMLLMMMVPPTVHDVTEVEAESAVKKSGGAVHPSKSRLKRR
jgi:hypothetical protein